MVDIDITIRWSQTKINAFLSVMYNCKLNNFSFISFIHLYSYSILINCGHHIHPLNNNSSW